MANRELTFEEAHELALLMAYFEARSVDGVDEATDRLGLVWTPGAGQVVIRDLGDGNTALVTLMTYGKGRICVGETTQRVEWMGFHSEF